MDNDPQLLKGRTDPDGLIRFFVLRPEAMKPNRYVSVDDEAAGELGETDRFLAHLGLGYTCKKTVDEENFTVEAMVSTNILDRYGEIMEPEGWRLKNFRKNPVVHYNHQDYIPPIAKSLAEEIRPNKGLWAKPKFHVGPEFSKLNSELWALVLVDGLNGWSVGWMPEKWEKIDDPTIKGEGRLWGREGIRFLQMELWEYSLVNIPAGQNALTLGVSLATVEAARLFGVTVPESELEGDMAVFSKAAQILISSPGLVEEMKAAANGKLTKPVGKTSAEFLEICTNRIEAMVNGTYSDPLGLRAIPVEEAAVVAVEMERAIEKLESAGSEMRQLAGVS